MAGIYPLDSAVSESGRFAPKSTDHQPVRIVVKNFGILSVDAYEEFKTHHSGLKTMQGAYSYYSENDVAAQMKAIVESVVSS